MKKTEKTETIEEILRDIRILLLPISGHAFAELEKHKNAPDSGPILRLIDDKVMRIMAKLMT